MDSKALKQSVLFGGILQVILVLVVKYLPSIGGGDTFLPAVGTAFAAMAGIRYTRSATHPALGSAAGGGLAAGGLSSLIGSALASVLGLAAGAEAQTILVASGTGAVAGLLGGIVGKFVPRAT